VNNGILIGDMIVTWKTVLNTSKRQKTYFDRFFDKLSKSVKKWEIKVEKRNFPESVNYKIYFFFCVRNLEVELLFFGYQNKLYFRLKCIFISDGSKKKSWKPASDFWSLSRDPCSFTDNKKAKNLILPIFKKKKRSKLGSPYFQQKIKF